MRLLAALALSLCLPLATDTDALLRALDGSDPQAARDAWESLHGQPDQTARAALATLAQTSARNARLRARLIEELGRPEDIERVLAHLDHPDHEVRRSLVQFLARRDLADHALAARIQGLVELGRDDPDLAVRAAAMRALGEIDDPASVAAMVDLFDELPPSEQVIAAGALPETARSYEPVARMLAGAFAPTESEGPLPDRTLAALLPLHGRLLADREGGAESTRERAPLILGLRHPASSVRLAAVAAFERLLARLRAVGEAPRALRVLAALESQGFDHRLIQFHRSRLAFYPGGDAQAAREAARALRERGAVTPAGDTDRVDERIWLFRSLYLEGMAETALGAPERGREPMLEAAAVLDGILAERHDLDHERSRLRHVEVLQYRALVELGLVFAALAEGTSRNAKDILARLREAHLYSLEAQLGSAREGEEAFGGWDGLLDLEISPFRLLFVGLEFDGLTIERGIELQKAFGQALAGICPGELPGFEPPTDVPAPWSDPLRDPRREELLHGIQEARVQQIADDIQDVLGQIELARVESPGVVPVTEQTVLQELFLRQRMLLRSLTGEGEEEGRELLELRVPCSLALWVARDLRNEGRTAESREIAARMREDLERNGISRWWYYLGLERLAQVEMAIGSSWIDEGEPARAQVELEKAVERLEGIEDRMEEQGATARQLAPVRSIRCSALVSLAVNANVKMDEPERALEYYERAYELRQDDFMRVLLACYRARSGRTEEARSLLREVNPHPQLYYNMACTHALLGEPDLALDYLGRDFLENHSSAASLDRQRRWAREDPDLSALRDLPAFRELVGD